ncbi:MAG TPA: HD domain-containing protein [Candidatus Sumerlaeota bacterium]|nr:HD domain-containing protein [Candidatus Sumerlaeota bacterium]HPK03344.1 HD domain-containing protein [Candidatus Sumerlaeota bacterium]
MEERLERQLAFVHEIDKLKRIERRNYLTDGSRRENSAEHSWHLALMALVLAEWSNEERIDLGRVLPMLLLHDLVEIDAGDTFVYDEAAHADKAAREEAAADRIFGLLPEEQGRRLRALWEEFESGQSAEAQFARALDRLQPIMMNFASGGKPWVDHRITRRQVVGRNQHIEQGSRRLWDVARGIIERACKAGLLADAK